MLKHEEPAEGKVTGDSLEGSECHVRRSDLILWVKGGRRCRVWNKGGSSPEGMMERVVSHGLKGQSVHLTPSMHWHWWLLWKEGRKVSEEFAGEDQEMCSPHGDPLTFP